MVPYFCSREYGWFIALNSDANLYCYFFRVCINKIYLYNFVLSPSLYLELHFQLVIQCAGEWIWVEKLGVIAEFYIYFILIIQCTA